MKRRIFIATAIGLLAVVILSAVGIFMFVRSLSAPPEETAKFFPT